MATKVGQDKADQGHVFLIDGSGYIFRAYHALPPMNRPDGTPVNAVYGFTSMVMKLIDRRNRPAACCAERRDGFCSGWWAACTRAPRRPE